MNNDCAGIQILSAPSKCHAGKFSSRPFAVQNTARIQHRHLGTKRAANPFNQRVFFNKRTFCIKVHHISRPIFNRGIAEPRPFLNKKFDATRVQIRYVVAGSRATFDEMQLRTRFNDYQRVFKLSRRQRQPAHKQNCLPTKLHHVTRRTCDL